MRISWPAWLFDLVKNRVLARTEPTMSRRCREITSHYVSVWVYDPKVKRWEIGPVWELPPGFCVLEFRPTNFEPFVEVRDLLHVPTSGYRPSGTPLALARAIRGSCGAVDSRLPLPSNGAASWTWSYRRSWEVMDAAGSGCDHGLISLPYIRRPENLSSTVPRLPERLSISSGYCRLPNRSVTTKRSSVEEALQSKFDEGPLDYLKSARQSVV